MTALQTAHSQFIHLARPIAALLGHIHSTMDSRASGAAGQKDSFFLGIQIQQSVALEHGQVYGPGSIHSHFLVHGDHHLQAGMPQCIVIQQRQSVGYGYTVVSPQTGSLCIDTVPLHRKFQRFTGHINSKFRLMHRHHIHMSLQDQGRLLLIARTGLLDDDDVPDLVLNILQPSFPGKARQIIADRLHIA